jgi:hypothetical protein
MTIPSKRRVLFKKLAGGKQVLPIIHHCAEPSFFSHSSFSRLLSLWLNIAHELLVLSKTTRTIYEDCILLLSSYYLLQAFLHHHGVHIASTFRHIFGSCFFLLGRIRGLCTDNCGCPSRFNYGTNSI